MDQCIECLGRVTYRRRLVVTSVRPAVNAVMSFRTNDAWLPAGRPPGLCRLSPPALLGRRTAIECQPTFQVVPATPCFANTYWHVTHG